MRRVTIGPRAPLTRCAISLRAMIGQVGSKGTDRKRHESGPRGTHWAN